MSGSPSVVVRAGQRALLRAPRSVGREMHARESRPAVGSSSGSSRPFTSSRPAAEAATPRSHLHPIAAKDPFLFETLLPPRRSAFVALAHRLKLISHKTDEQTGRRRLDALIVACTDASYKEMARKVLSHGPVMAGRGIVRNTTVEGYEKVGLVDKTQEQLDTQYMDAAPTHSNEALAALGNSLLGLMASEHLHLRYPNLPTRVLKAALSSYVGPNTMADLAAELGLTAKGVVRWHRRVETGGREAQGKRRDGNLLSRDVHADAMRAVVALLFQQQGLAVARSFVEQHLLTRRVQLLSLLKFNDPKRTLSDLCRRMDKERPQSRMIAETGRLSISPVFVVGVYSGSEKLGEGTGTSIRMAEFRAAEDSLRRFYLSERPAGELSLPSTTLEVDFAPPSPEDAAVGGQRGVWNVDREHEPASAKRPFVPSQIGKSEVVFGSKG